MNNNEKITHLTENFMDEIKTKFKKAGYKTKTTKHCAIVQTAFTKGNTEIAFCGWKKGVYGINYSIIHSLYVTDTVTYKDSNPNIFTMPGQDPKNYGAGMIENKIATDNELEAYNINIKKAMDWVIANI